MLSYEAKFVVICRKQKTNTAPTTAGGFRQASVGVASPHVDSHWLPNAVVASLLRGRDQKQPPSKSEVSWRRHGVGDVLL